MLLSTVQAKCKYVNLIKLDYPNIIQFRIQNDAGIA